jgi:hypothetical protein
MKLESEGVSRNLLYFIQSLYNLWAPIFRAVFRRDGLSRSCHRTQSIVNVSQREPDRRVCRSRCVVHIPTAILNCSFNVYLIDVKRSTWHWWLVAVSRFKNAPSFVGGPGFRFCQETGCSEIFVIFSATPFRSWHIVLKIVPPPLSFGFITHGSLYLSTVYKQSV